jgi:cellulose synthase/poly-beta-1,6-N-acetylglucosamine synthase-like glycosyltransferase
MTAENSFLPSFWFLDLRILFDLFTFWTVCFFLAFILTYNVLQLNLLFHYTRKKKPASLPPLEENALPFVTIRLSLNNEPYVAERMVDNIVALEYPRDRFEVQILDDSTDETTSLCEIKAEQYRKQGFDIQVLHRRDRSGYKAGALSYGLAQAKGGFVAIFDADFLPDKKFLQDTVPYFQDKKVGVVQTRSPRTLISAIGRS